MLGPDSSVDDTDNDILAGVSLGPCLTSFGESDVVRRRVCLEVPDFVFPDVYDVSPSLQRLGVGSGHPGCETVEGVAVAIHFATTGTVDHLVLLFFEMRRVFLDVGAVWIDLLTFARLGRLVSTDIAFISDNRVTLHLDNIDVCFLFGSLRC